LIEKMLAVWASILDRRPRMAREAAQDCAA
jgi:hypothetical protein